MKLKEFISKKPLIKKIVKCLIAPFVFNVSSNYRKIKNLSHINSRYLVDGWKSDLIPLAQRRLVEKNLSNYRKGEIFLPFDILVEHLTEISEINSSSETSVLEVGCSSGYNYEAMSIRGLQINYQGCDYSDGLINLAKKIYPKINFRVEDATSLTFETGSFDVVISGGCLLHIPNYEAAIREAARVAREYVIFHITPILHLSKTQSYIKKAYGVDVPEIHFNEEELVKLFYKCGLTVIGVKALSTSWSNGDAHVNKNYLCKKI